MVLLHFLGIYNINSISSISNICCVIMCYNLCLIIIASLTNKHRIYSCSVFLLLIKFSILILFIRFLNY